MKRYVFLILLLFIQIISFCQYRIDWQNCYGTDEDDDVLAITETQDGFIVTGQYCDDPTYRTTKGVTLRIDHHGDTIWQKIKNTDNDNGVEYIDRLTDGDYIMMYQDLLLYPNAHYGNVGFRRIDVDGNTIWEKAYGNSFGRTNGVFRGCATSDGGFVGCAPYNQAGGDISHYWGGSADIWVIKVDGNGNMVWETSVGTTGSEAAGSIQQTTDGGFLMAITNIVPGTGNMMCKEHQEANYIPHLVKLDPNGNVEWSFCYGSDHYYTNINGVIVLEDGYLLYGDTTADDGDFEGAGYHLGYHAGMPTHSRLSDAYLMKTDFDFNIIWCRCYGGRGDDFTTKVFQNDDGGFTVFAATKSIDGDVQSYNRLPYNPHYYIGLVTYVSWIFRVDHNGELLWERVTGGNYDFAQTYSRDVIKHNDKEYTIASQMTYYEPGWETYDINCPYNANMPGSGINFWVYHITDTFDYDNVGEIEDNKNVVGLEIHPNPARDILNISFADDSECQSVEIYAIDGRLLKTQIDNFDKINIADLTSGLYLIKVRMNDGAEFTERIVKE